MVSDERSATLWNAVAAESERDDGIVRALSHRRRRFVVSWLEGTETPASLEEVATALADWESSALAGDVGTDGSTVGRSGEPEDGGTGGSGERGGADETENAVPDAAWNANPGADGDVDAAWNANPGVDGDVDAAWNATPDAVTSVAIDLHHVHLPVLEDVGLLEYDSGEHLIAATATGRLLAAAVETDA